MSVPDLATSLEHFLTYRPHHAAFLFVHHQVNRLMTTAAQLKQQYPDWPCLALSPVLAKSLCDIAPAQRPRQTATLLATALHQRAPGPLLCTDLDLLFEPSLQLDPLRLFLDASRKTTLIIAWPGTIQHNHLAYAVPEHAHYRTWSQPELCDYCVVQLSDH